MSGSGPAHDANGERVEQFAHKTRIDWLDAPH
jgi:hypothetical protein